jgi:hypothetical protein
LEKLNKWVIPAVLSKQVYKQGMFDLMSRLAIKTIEKTVQVAGNTQTIYFTTRKIAFCQGTMPGADAPGKFARSNARETPGKLHLQTLQ